MLQGRYGWKHRVWVNNNHISISNYVVEKSAVFEERCGGTLPTAGMEDMETPGLAGKHYYAELWSLMMRWRMLQERYGW